MIVFLREINVSGVTGSHERRPAWRPAGRIPGPRIQEIKFKKCPRSLFLYVQKETIHLRSLLHNDEDTVAGLELHAGSDAGGIVGSGWGS